MPQHAPSSPSRPIARELLERFRAIVGDDGILCDADELLVYECDGYVVEKKTPDVVLFPTSREQVVAIVKTCNEFDVPFVPRGAGTSLSGGCLPVGGGVMIALTRMKRILEVNLARPLRRRRAGARQRPPDAAPQGDRLSLRPRSFEPGSLHDRRKCRDQFRRARTPLSTA